jgi:hypothetical protein
MNRNHERSDEEAMRIWRQRLFRGVIVGALSCLPGAAWAASEVDILIDKLVEKGTLTNVEAGLIRREVSETKEGRTKELAKEIDPLLKIQTKGDIRLRDEYRNRVGTGADSHRQRIRFRYGAEAKVASNIKVVSRIATGTGFDFETGSNSDNSDINRADPISTNDSFDDFFRKKSIVLDLAYVEYAPSITGLTSAKFVGGIMENPMWVSSPMVWDGDLSWDGAAVKLTKELGPATLFVNNGAFSLDTDESEPASLFIIQGGAAITPFAGSEAEVVKNLKFTTGWAYHDYRNTANSSDAGTDPIARESDNTTAAHDFNQLNPSIELASVVGGYPVAFFGDWVHNLSTVTAGNNKGNDHGFAFGAKVGKATTPWSLKSGWEGGYMWERLERDAAFDEFVDSDFGGGGTNRKGHKVWGTLAVLKNSTVGATFFFNQEAIKGAKFREDRLQLDWITKF